MQPVPAALASSTAAGTPKVTFDYSAQVPPGDVYATERAEAPLPVFRSLAQQVEVRADYYGPAAAVGLSVRLTSSTGWSRLFPLREPTPLEDGGTLKAVLDLPELDGRGKRVAAQTRMPFEGLAVDLVASVQAEGHSVDPQRLAPALAHAAQARRRRGHPRRRRAARRGRRHGRRRSPRRPHPRQPDRRPARLAPRRPAAHVDDRCARRRRQVVARRRRDEDDLARGRRLLGRLLLEVEPLPLEGSRVIDVPGPRDLARLAERYGLLVLHWAEADEHVFVVQDEGTTYRWTTVGAPDAEPEPSFLSDAAEDVRSWLDLRAARTHRVELAPTPPARSSAPDAEEHRAAYAALEREQAAPRDGGARRGGARGRGP